mmetsp:Transcript_1545/g.2676  ORF Transcript_1545/g.2676 Transcript_1545/m.2676 type:complete len:224 (+) Transcript_1545:1564-2235(+)
MSFVFSFDFDLRLLLWRFFSLVFFLLRFFSFFLCFDLDLSLLLLLDLFLLLLDLFRFRLFLTLPSSSFDLDLLLRFLFVLRTFSCSLLRCLVLLSRSCRYCFKPMGEPFFFFDFLPCSSTSIVKNPARDSEFSVPNVTPRYPGKTISFQSSDLPLSFPTFFFNFSISFSRSLFCFLTSRRSSLAESTAAFCKAISFLDRSRTDNCFFIPTISCSRAAMPSSFS